VRSYPSAVNPDIAVVLPEGRLDAMASPVLENTLASLESQGAKQVVLNLHETSYISSSGLRAILVHARRLRQAGGDLKLCCLGAKVARAVQIAGFDAVLEIFANEGLAAEAFQQPKPLAPHT
jgi:stage II sporulation protein AA (anti-sigma F factor antagonist)